MGFTMSVYVRRYFEAAIAGILIFFKVFSDYKKLKTKLTFSGHCSVNEAL